MMPVLRLTLSLRYLSIWASFDLQIRATVTTYRHRENSRNFCEAEGRKCKSLSNCFFSLSLPGFLIRSSLAEMHPPKRREQ